MSFELTQDEVEILSISDARIHETSYSPPPLPVLSQLQYIMLTNFRLSFFDAKSEYYAINLKDVSKVKMKFSFMTGSLLKITIGDHFIVLKMKDKSLHSFHTSLLYYLEKKSWLSSSSSALKTTNLGVVSPAVYAGVGGLQRRQDAEMQLVGSITDSALSDLKSLLKNANEVVKIVEQYTSLQEARRRADKNTPKDLLQEQDSQLDEMGAILMEVGLISPVMNHGGLDRQLYLKKLGSQISSLLLSHGRIGRMQGMLTLTDAYYLYNKARGGALVSPDDFLAACSALSEELEMRHYPSGVAVIQLREYSDGKVMFSKIQRVMELTPSTSPLPNVSPLQLSKALKIPIMLAKAQLLAAEDSGRLCRDESFSGIVFYTNKFLNF